MPIRRSRAVRAIALMAFTAMASTLHTHPVQAAAGDPVSEQSYAFTAKILIGDNVRSCSGALVDAQWILTASSCFAATGQPAFPITAGAPAEKTTATIGRTDLSTTAGHVVEITELVPRSDRDLVMAKLAAPVTDIAPAVISSTALAPGEVVHALGYGRTADEWVPNQLHTGAFTVETTSDTIVAIESAGGAICRGDAGGPALREKDGQVELVAVHNASWQGGCFGETETRTGAVETRLDDIHQWIQQVRRLPQASTVTSGDFNGDGRDDLAALYDNGPSPEGKYGTSLYAFYSSGTGFSAPRKVWESGSFTWSRSQLTSGDYNGDGKDDVAVFYDGGTATDGKAVSSLYTFTSDGTEFQAPRKTWTSSGSFTWSRSKPTSGDYNGDGKDDVAVFYDGGTATDG
ncbi:trypsin-like serine protease, partial [Streptomyces sp. NPDC090994]|uniref:trypsin-like serine protease n=1 Tax=Streptomyces sp. NPDC090994 TaxID=3365969 RepID=UPI0038250959